MAARAAVALADIPIGVAGLARLVAMDDRALHGVISRRDFTVAPALNARVSVHQGDITNLAVDAIVNAANRRMLGGGGVDGAIHRRAGPELVAECRAFPVRHDAGEEVRCDTGDAKITKGYHLPARHVVHTVGPVGEHPDALASCYRRSLKVAVGAGCRSIAFPSISTGVYGYPVAPAAWVALTTVRDVLESSPASIDRVVFCVFSDSDASVYKALLPVVFPPA